VEVHGAVRRYVLVEGRSRREAARVFGLSRDTIDKMCRFSIPPGYQRSNPPEKPKLGPLTPVIDAILASDRSAPHRSSSGTRPSGFSNDYEPSTAASAATRW
jgi:hypothetical protein